MTDREFLSNVLPKWPINSAYEISEKPPQAVIYWRYRKISCKATIPLDAPGVCAGFHTVVEFTVELKGHTKACKHSFSFDVGASFIEAVVNAELDKLELLTA